MQVVGDALVAEQRSLAIADAMKSSDRQNRRGPFDMFQPIAAHRAAARSRCRGNTRARRQIGNFRERRNRCRARFLVLKTIVVENARTRSGMLPRHRQSECHLHRGPRRWSARLSGADFVSSLVRVHPLGGFGASLLWFLGAGPSFEFRGRGRYNANRKPHPGPSAAPGECPARIVESIRPAGLPETRPDDHARPSPVTLFARCDVGFEQARPAYFRQADAVIDDIDNAGRHARAPQ